MYLKNQSVAEINNFDFFPADIFICSSSFEDRCRVIPESVRPSSVDKVFIFQNINVSEVSENAATLKRHFGEKAFFVNVSTKNSIESADNIFNTLHGLANSPLIKSIVVDITTFTHESLLLLLNVLLSAKHLDLRITLLYSSALEYSTDQDDIRKKWLSSGIAGIRTILGYSGDVNPLNKTHLIMFVGYEASRSSKIIELVEPSIISLGYGEEGTSTNSNHEAASAYFHAVVKEMAMKHARVHPFPFSCSDPFKVKKQIIDQSNIDGESNVVVAPMNTKISTIGVGLAAIESPKIQLCYAPAIQYNFNYYSKVSDTFGAFELTT